MNSKLKTKSLKTLPIKNDLTLLTSNHANNLAMRCQHRLSTESYILKTKEKLFLIQFDDQVTNKHKYLFTNKQISWLIQNLDKPQT